MKYEFNTERGDITLFDWRIEVMRAIYDTTTVNNYIKRPDSIGVAKRVEVLLGIMDIIMPSFKKVIILKYKYFLDDKAVTDIIGEENIHNMFRFAGKYVHVGLTKKWNDLSSATYHILRYTRHVFRYAKMCNVNRYIISNDPDVFLVTPPEPVEDIPDEDANTSFGFGTKYTFGDVYTKHPIEFINTHGNIGAATVIKFNNMMLGVSQKYNWFRRHGYERVVDFVEDAKIRTKYSEYTSESILRYYQSYNDTF